MPDERSNDIRSELSRVATAQAVDPTMNVLEHIRLHSLRQDDLREAESAYIRREMMLRADHARQLASAEKERLDAIRAIDAQSINLASSAVSQVQAAMDAKINLVAERSQQQLQGTTTLLQERLLSIERNQYQGQGAKAQQVEGRDQNNWLVGAVVGGLVGAGGLVVGVVGIILAATK